MRCKGLLTINSYNRNNGSTTNFEWYPGGGLENYDKCYFHNASIPNSYNNVNDYNKFIRMDLGIGFVNITLDPDYYSSTELCQAIQSGLFALLGPGISFNVTASGKVRITNAFNQALTIYGSNDEILYMLGFTDFSSPQNIVVPSGGIVFSTYTATDILYSVFYLEINGLISDQSYYPIYKGKSLLESIPIQVELNMTTYTPDNPPIFNLNNQTSAISVRILDFKNRVIDLNGKTVAITLVLL